MRIFVRATGITWLALCLLTAMAWWAAPFLARVVLPPAAPVAVGYLTVVTLWLFNVFAGSYAAIGRRPARWRPMAVLGTAMVLNGWILLRVEFWLLARVRSGPSWQGLAWADGVPSVLFSAVGLSLLGLGLLAQRAGRAQARAG